jgi:hypothetical protein
MTLLSQSTLLDTTINWHFTVMQLKRSTRHLIIQAFIFIPVEKVAPFECSFLAGDEVMLEIGLKENRRLLNLYNYCMSSGKWHGYEDKVQTIGLPNWAMNKFNLEEQLL